MLIAEETEDCTMLTMVQLAKATDRNLRATHVDNSEYLGAMASFEERWQKTEHMYTEVDDCSECVQQMVMEIGC